MPQRFFVNGGDIAGDGLVMEGPVANHIARSLRMRSGDRIVVVDDSRQEHGVLLRSVRPERVEGDIAAEAIAAFRAKAALYAKQFGYAGYGIREVTIGTSDAQNGPVPMMRMQAAAAGSTSGDALSIEPGKALVTATVNGTVQMK